MSDKKDKAIRISGRTRNTLIAISSKNETYDDVIKRLIYQLNEARDEAKDWKAIATKLREELDA